MANNERTSPDLAAKAAIVLKMTDTEIVRRAHRDPGLFRSLAACVLTQAPDKQSGSQPAEPPPPPESQVVQSGVKFPCVPVANKVDLQPHLRGQSKPIDYDQA